MRIVITLLRLEMKRIFKNPLPSFIYASFVGISIVLYGLSGGSFEDKRAFSRFLLLLLLIASHFQARDCIQDLKASGRLQDIVLSTTALELIIFLLLLVEGVLILLGFYLNLSLLYVLELLSYDRFLLFIQSLTFSFLGVVSLSYLIAGMLSLSRLTAYLGLVLSIPLQTPLCLFFLGFITFRDSSSLLFLGALSLLLFVLSILTLPRVLSQTV